MTLAFISLIVPTCARACSCAPHEPSEFTSFKGTVASVEVRREHGDEWRSVCFDDIENWNGPDVAATCFSTGLGGGDCGFPFIRGERYEVFLFSNSDHGHGLETGICTPTHQVDDVVPVRARTELIMGILVTLGLGTAIVALRWNRFRRP